MTAASKFPPADDHRQSDETPMAPWSARFGLDEAASRRLARLGLAASAERGTERLNHLLAGRFDAEFPGGSAVSGVVADHGDELSRLAAATLAAHGIKAGVALDLGAVIGAVMGHLGLVLEGAAAAGPRRRSRHDLLQLTDELEREIGGAVDVIGAQAQRLTDGACRLDEVAERMRGAATSVSSSATTTAEDVQTVAGATEELEASSRDIAQQVVHASELTGEASAKATDTSSKMGGLNEITSEIRSALDLIQRIASQTRMLALNATIEAARAGDMGKGFAVVASEVKGLAHQTELATGTIGGQAQAIRQATEGVTTMVQAMGGIIQSINMIAGHVAAATEQQRAATAEISRSAVRAADCTREVARHASLVLSEAAATTEIASHVSDLSQVMGRDIRDLHRRISVILRSSVAGDRRDNDRAPCAVPFSACIAGTWIDGRTADLSPTGALLAMTVPEGVEPFALRIEGIGTLRTRVVIRTELGTHAEFRDLSAADSQAIADTIARERERDAAYVAMVDDAARRVSQAFEQGLARGALSEADLFDVDYQPIHGSNPQQHLTRFTAFAEQVVSAILDPVPGLDSRIVFCLPVDRNGYAPVHNPQFSQPQRPDDPEWNIGHCRNRRIFDDAAGLLAARNTKDHLIQLYNRDMGGQRVLLKEIDAPIQVRNRHWGAVRMALRQ